MKKMEVIGLLGYIIPQDSPDKAKGDTGLKSFWQQTTWGGSVIMLEWILVYTGVGFGNIMWDHIKWQKLAYAVLSVPLE